MNLTPKQDEFARAYVETGCASTAYRRAYDVKATSDKSVHENASFRTQGRPAETENRASVQANECRADQQRRKKNNDRRKDTRTVGEEGSAHANVSSRMPGNIHSVKCIIGTSKAVVQPQSSGPT